VAQIRIQTNVSGVLKLATVTANSRPRRVEPGYKSPMPSATHGSFVWYDLLTPDPDAAAAYYAQVVGWTTQAFPSSDVAYTMFVGAQGPVAGTTRPEGAGARPQWIGNVFVDDVDRTAALATELGGRVLSPPKDYPTVGRLAVVVDPQGVPMNLFRPARAMELHDTTRPGELTWHELVASDHAAAFAFYSRLFGWQKRRAVDLGPIGQYLVYGQATGDLSADLGGMFTLPAAGPRQPMWLYYIQVADLDAAVARAKAGGGSVANGPMQVPGGARVAQLVDPQGVLFALHENAPAAKAP
jgi:predicted enzyme related to lactoylglutathione lyase